MSDPASMSNNETVIFGPGAEPSTEEASAFKRLVNAHATALGITAATEDGLGEDTFEVCASVAWRMGLNRSDTRVVGRHVWEVLQDPELRSEDERRRARGRDRIYSPPLTTQELVLGVEALSLIEEWPSWINRRVEKCAFASDLLTFNSRQSVDFDAGVALQPPSDWKLGHSRLVPLTYSEKWHLKNVDLTDQDGRSLPLITRKQHGALGASILTSLAYLVGERVTPLAATRPLPREIAEDLRGIAHEERAAAEQLWESIGSPRTADPRVSDLRKALADSERFMELAYDIAGQFLLSTAIPWPDGGGTAVADGMRRRLVKFGCIRRAHRPQGKRWEDKLARAGDRSESFLSERAPRIPHAGPGGAGHIRIHTKVRAQPSGEAQLEIDHAPPVQTFVVIKRPDGQRRRIKWEATGDTWAANLPAGTYEVQARTSPAYHLQDDTAQTVEIAVGDTKTVEFAVRARRVVAPPAGAIGRSAPKTSPRRRLMRSIGLISQVVMVPLKINEGGSIHFETEAPTGLQISRAKIVAVDGSVLDIKWGASPVTHLYVPALPGRPAAGYALINLRPRGETIIRAATTSALLAAALLIAITVKWWASGSGAQSGVTIALAVPGVFSAWAAQGTDSPITNSIVYGLRGLALIPGLCCFAAATFIATTSKTRMSGCIELSTLAAIATIAAAALWLVSHTAARPPEQILTARAQGKRIAERYAVDAPSELYGKGFRWRVANLYHLIRTRGKRAPAQGPVAEGPTMLQTMSGRD